LLVSLLKREAMEFVSKYATSKIPFRRVPVHPADRPVEPTPPPP